MRGHCSTFERSLTPMQHVGSHDFQRRLLFVHTCRHFHWRVGSWSLQPDEHGNVKALQHPAVIWRWKAILYYLYMILFPIESLKLILNLITYNLHVINKSLHWGSLQGPHLTSHVCQCCHNRGQKLVCSVQRSAVNSMHRFRSSVACHPVKLDCYGETQLTREDRDYTRVDLPLQAIFALVAGS